MTREVVRIAQVPVGVNALRNDAQAALAIATATEAAFMRVNVHMGVTSDQGIIQGMSHETLRLRAALRSSVLIFADVGVKHATPLGDRGLVLETRDLSERGLVDALIVSGVWTGAETSLDDIALVRQHTTLPVLLGGGATPDNLHRVYDQVDGLIVGSTFKQAGQAENMVEEARVKAFTAARQTLEQGGAALHRCHGTGVESTLPADIVWRIYRCWLAVDRTTLSLVAEEPSATLRHVCG